MDRKITAYYWRSKEGYTGWRVSLKHPRDIGLPFSDFDVVELSNHPAQELAKALREAMWPHLRNDPGTAADIHDAFMAALKSMHATKTPNAQGNRGNR